ncbi:hypothetical protein SAV14893_022160 [Streptomyces avermitilis]|uniref:Uncharacterized protein n=1 Tax=Streptomyces avermitilis TaxID=33903 RepID=A0A4D4LXI2_STRAX|nr:hypothetical protein SAV14893_022160 [Streptomyces avermitilis]GDY85967.1 hypothetical protein SAVCW2_51660 [Streptomyces avermitilis]
MNVEPGGYVCRIARLSIGLAGSPFSRSHALVTAEFVPDSSPGSYDGAETSARIRPLDGSIAATAPRRPASPSYAARCAPAARVVTTLPPGFRSRETPFHKGSSDSIGSVPARMPSAAFSRPVVPYTCEAKPVTGAYRGPSWYVRS